MENLTLIDLVGISNVIGFGNIVVVLDTSTLCDLSERISTLNRVVLAGIDGAWGDIASRPTTVGTTTSATTSICSPTTSAG